MAPPSVEFIFKDNGRGPELKEEFKLDKDGTFISYHVAGQSTFGAPIDETFTRTGDKAVWKSTSDKGEQEVFGTALYTPLGGTPEESLGRDRGAGQARRRQVAVDPGRHADHAQDRSRAEVTQGQGKAVRFSCIGVDRSGLHADASSGRPRTHRRACSLSSSPGFLADDARRLGEERRRAGDAAESC